MTSYEPNIDEWIYLIMGNHIEHCKEQELALTNNIIPVLERPDVYVDADRIARGLSLQKYFPYRLLPWERYQFAIMFGVFLRDKSMPYDDIYFHVTRDIIGRGAGKNGFIDLQKGGGTVDGMLDEKIKTPLCSVYGDIVTDDEESGQMTLADFSEETGIFDFDRPDLHCTGCKRTGCVIYDEKHQYTDTRNMNTLKSGTGKMKWWREITITTDGHVRGGVLDNEKEQNMVILRDYNPANRIFVNWFRIEAEEEWNQIDKIVKANPSLADPSFASLRTTIIQEIQDMPFSPEYYPEFLAKRCNFPISDPESAVAEWSDIVKCTEEPAFQLEPGMQCVGGLDYTKTNDFCGCILTFRKNGKIVNLHHSFICAKSKDLPAIKAPIQEWQKKGYCTIVDDVEIPTDLPVLWFSEMAMRYTIRMIGIDAYRYTWLNAKFKQIMGFEAFDKENKRIYLIRPSDIIKASPVINSLFLKQSITGWDRMMAWYTNNAKRVMDTKGNVTYGKIEPKLRKTDGFMAWVHSICCLDFLPEEVELPAVNMGVFTY